MIRLSCICGFESRHLHQITSSGLIATNAGWKCSEVGCSFTQNWAHNPPTAYWLDEYKKTLANLTGTDSDQKNNVG